MENNFTIPELTCYTEIDPAFICGLLMQSGLITNEQRQALLDESKRRCDAANREARRRHYEKLKREFEYGL